MRSGLGDTSALAAAFKRLRDQGAEPTARQFRELREKALGEPAAVVNDSGQTVERGEVVDDRPPLRLPAGMQDVELPEAEPAGRGSRRELDQNNLAPDDSRRRLPQPVWDKRRRRDGFPAYVSPRATGRPSYGQRQAAAFLAFGHRRSSTAAGLPAQSFSVLRGFGESQAWNA